MAFLREVNIIRRIAHIIFALCITCVWSQLSAQNVVPSTGGLLHGVKAVQIDPTVVADPAKIKDASAPNLIQDSLRNAFRSADFEIADSAAIRAHGILHEFSSGSMAKRL